VTPETIIIVILAGLAGTGLGTITGLVPGVHVNTVSVMLLAATASLATLFVSMGIGAGNVGLVVGCIIISTSVTHTFVDVVPSTFLGAPEEDTALAVLPMHELLLSGRGYRAIALSALGSALGALFSFTLLMPYRLVMGPPINFYPVLRSITFLILVGICLFLMLTDPARPATRRMLRYHPEGHRMRLRIDGIENEGERTHGARGSDGAGWSPDGRGTHGTGENAYPSTTNTYRCTVLEVEPLEKDTLEMDTTEEGTGDVQGTPSKGSALLRDRRELADGEEVEGYYRSVMTRGPHSYALGRLAVITTFVLSGIFGLVIFELRAPSPLELPSSILFPAFAGLFGLPALIISLEGGGSPPPQDLDPGEFDGPTAARFALRGTFAGSVVGFLPGVSSGIATILSSTGAKDRSSEGAIVGLSAVNTANAIFVLAALFLVLKARSGAAVAVMEVLPIPPWSGYVPPVTLLLLFTCVILSSGLGIILVLYFGRRFANSISSIDYPRVVKVVIASIVSLVFIFNGPFGLLILGIGLVVGLLPASLGVRKTALMGVLLLPVLTYINPF